MSTRLVKGANPEELQKNLLQLEEEEDRPFYPLGCPVKDEGYWYQFMQDDNPRLLTLAISEANIVSLFRKLKREESK